MSQVLSQSAVDIISKESSQTEIQQVESSCSPLLDQASPSETSQPQENEAESVSSQVDGVPAVADHSPVMNDNKRPREQESTTQSGELSTSVDKELVPQEVSSEVNQSVVEVATTSSEELEESPKKKQKLDEL